METTIGWISKDTIWWIFTLPAFMGSQTLKLNIYTLLFLTFTCFSIAILSWASSTGGGIAWINGRNRLGKIPIPGPKGLPLVGSLFALSHGLPHRTLTSMARTRAATCLMAFSAGSTPFVVSSEPQISKEILNSSHFADRPIKQSARSLLFDRAIGFSPNGAYWRSLRRIATSHLFSPCRISAHEPGRRLDSAAMLRNIETAQKNDGFVFLRKHLQLAALNNIMGTVFGKRYENNSDELEELIGIVSEGFELLGAFNWSDHLPWLSYFYDPYRIKERCMALQPRVKKLVGAVIEEHKLRGLPTKLSDDSDFVNVLLSLDGGEKLQEDDMIAVLWEMIFRGTDTTALITEWTIAELVRHPNIQQKLQKELDEGSTLTDADMARLPYLQSVVKETLRVHPPGPLLSWARLSTSDVHLSNGMVVPANTVAMVNMWAITHDPKIWKDPEEFNPDRFSGDDVDVRGGDLRLAPFGAGRRVCPGKNLGLVTVTRWVAELVKEFQWVQEPGRPVRLCETLKLSCQMKHPLRAVAIKRNVTKN